MNGIVAMIGENINIIIVGFAIVVAVMLAMVIKKLTELENHIRENRKKKSGHAEYTEGGFTIKQDAYTWEDTLEQIEEFNKIQTNYSMVEQLIPIFPLLGLLGTVSGLIMQLGDMEQMKEAMSISMFSTFLGIIFAILFKLADAIWVSRKMDKMEQEFDQFERKYQLAKDQYDQGGNA